MRALRQIDFACARARFLSVGLWLLAGWCLWLCAPSRRGFCARTRVSVFGLRVSRERAYTQECARARRCAHLRNVHYRECVDAADQRTPPFTRTPPTRHSKTCFDVAQCAYNTPHLHTQARGCALATSVCVRMYDTTNEFASVLHIYVSTNKMSTQPSQASSDLSPAR